MVVASAYCLLLAFPFGALAVIAWFRWCDLQEEKLRIQAHIAELEMCYGTEQHFLKIEDDKEHLASITPKIGLPSMTDEEQAEAEREVAADETA